MAIVSNQFDSYKVFYYTGGSVESMIHCYQGATYAGRIVFYKDDTSIPANANYYFGPSIHYPLSQFNDLISILRYEKPLFLSLNTSTLQGFVGTSEKEPVGEEEA